MFLELNIILDMLPQKPTECIKALKSLTRENPCCRSLEQIILRGKPLPIITKNTFEEEDLLLNLPLLLHDIHEFILERHNQNQEANVRQYKQNISSLKRASLLYRNSKLNNNRIEALHHPEKMLEDPAFILSVNPPMLPRRPQQSILSRLAEIQSNGISLPLVNPLHAQMNAVVTGHPLPLPQPDPTLLSLDITNF